MSFMGDIKLMLCNKNELMEFQLIVRDLLNTRGVKVSAGYKFQLFVFVSLIYCFLRIIA